MNDRVLSVLGIAQRAGKIESGDDQVMRAIRSNKAKVVIIARDAAHNANKKMTDKCASYGVRLVTYGTREQLGHALGKRERVVVAVTDNGLARLLLSRLEKSHER